MIPAARLALRAPRLSNLWNMVNGYMLCSMFARCSLYRNDRFCRTHHRSPKPELGFADAAAETGP